MIVLPEIENSDSPILMLNIVRFKDRRLYFEEYIPAFKIVIEKLGITGAKLSLVSDVLANIVADDSENWDAIILVEYPSVKAFKTMAESKEYEDLAAPLRVAALQELKLYMTRKIEL
ncbi:DUF1330 domain-containing protein [Dyadobacter sp. LJ53]|uniref:DUF1330 domain-containing protein n=1 Tax=Dyadobacter chenwenxiniae TaxID=2906456 RepID=UPI001F45B11A|nr:DUF1330 domain-containing protein [Dyadobacter chenwenxiniae]MCF0051683.1 DUF1330 domain-containing protein [Dyadobacter chenwenxiniae]